MLKHSRNPDISGRMRCKKVFLIGMLMFLGAVTLFAQAPDTLWTKTYGGVDRDYGQWIQQTADDGFIITGKTKSYGAGNYDVWLIKTEASGNTLWTKTFGGSDRDWGNAVQKTNDSGYIITGLTKSFGAGNGDVWLIKTDAEGNTLWTRTFGGSGYDRGISVQQTTDEGYIIVGTTRSYGAGIDDIWLIKTDSLGNTLWTQTFGGGSDDYGSSVQQTNDGGYIVIGHTGSYGAKFYNVWLIKTDSLGNTLWTKTFGGNSNDVGTSVRQTTDSGYIITGYTYSYGAGGCDVWLIKTDVEGDTLWTRTFGGSSDDHGYSIQQTSDEGYIIVGNTYSYGAGSYDVWLIRTDVEGNTLWTKVFGGSDGDYGLYVQETTDGGYIIVGSTSSYGAGMTDVWLIKTEPEVIGIDEQEPSQNLDIISQCEPNPFKDKTLIKYSLPKSRNVYIAVYNILGQKVTTLINNHENVGTHSVIWDGRDESGSSVSNGVYFYQLESENCKSEIRKMLLLR